MMPVTEVFGHLRIKLQEIKSATNDFADGNCIGRGGFGNVYKGELLLSEGQSQTIVAIKRLNPQFGQGNNEFWNEILMLSQYKHENLVSLLGFCDENNEKIIVYEYMSKTSLNLHLNSCDLTWIQRLKICIGASHGLVYLHNPDTTSQQRILHRDIKSANILVDENWNAKISDLGLSKIGPANQEHTFQFTNVVGTFGYTDPVYIKTGLLKKEMDVYSFGVVLFEVLCGRLTNLKGHPSLIDLVTHYYKENRINEVVFGNIQDEIVPKSLKAFTTVAYQCLNKKITERPLMTKVLSMLENALEYQEQGLQESGASSSSFCRITINDLEESVPVTQKPFVQENVLSTIYKGDFPCTAGQFFNSLLRDGSNFTHSYHSDLMNVNLKIGRWHSEKEYDGQVREITFRPTIQQLFCTTFIASTPEGMTKEKQRILLSPDKRSLVFETLRQNAEHGFFKAHCRWELKTESESSCSIEVKVGVPSRNVMFRIICKWFFINKFKKELKVMLEVARSTIPTNGPIEAPHRSRCLQYTYFLMQSLMDLLLAILSLSHVGPPIIIQI